MAEALKKVPEKKERTRLQDLGIAEQLGLQMLSGISDLQRISHIDFTHADPSQITEAWDRMQGPYGALVAYYEHFTEMQPPHEDGKQSWQDIQPYASIRGQLSNRDATLERLYQHKWAEYYRKTFHEEAQKLLHIISTDFKLPDSALEPDMSLEQRAEILTIQTGPELFGLRFMPVYRKLFVTQEKKYYDEFHKPFEAKVMWNSEDVLNRITFKRDGRAYYVGSSGSLRELEELLDETVLVTSVENNTALQKDKDDLPFPVIDVDRTLTNGYHDYVFTEEAKSLFCHLDEQQVPYVLWSRAEPERIKWVMDTIASQNYSPPQLACYFDRRSWPFQTVKKLYKEHYSFTPDTSVEIARQIREARTRLRLNPRKNGFKNSKNLVKLISDFVIATADKDLTGIMLQGKCPWFIPLSDTGSQLDVSVAESLFARGVLIDDSNYTVRSAHYLGFNFIHVPSPKSLINVREFIS